NVKIHLIVRTGGQRWSNSVIKIWNGCLNESKIHTVHYGKQKTQEINMYEYLIGKITAINPHYIVVEVNGIGYQLQVANPFRYEENTTQKVYVYQAVRENDVTLYGFYDLAEKQLFLKLISVSGIGPKSALAILATNDQGGFVAAINADDEAYLTKFPSIGKKTAKQIILDLKGKMDDIETPTPMVDQQNLALDFDNEQIGRASC